MEGEQTATNKLLFYLEDSDYLHYLTSDQEKVQLNYPEECLGTDSPTREIIALDCQMISTTQGEQVCSIVIIDSLQQVVLQAIVKPKGEVIDYITFITGFKKGDFDQVDTTLESIRERVEDAIRGKIVVGHDLANDFRDLRIYHKDVIDTVALLPHFNGWPSKNKLKDLASKYLKMHIQMGFHSPKEDALAALRLVIKHVQDGRGVYKEVPGLAKTLTDPVQIIKEARLEYSRIQGLYLRGSRALGYATPQSDYDYILVYNTESTVDRGLIKLFNVDISIFDVSSFCGHLNEKNNISLIEVFFLDKQFRIIDKIPFPKIHPFRFRQSTSEEGYRSLRKSKFNLKTGNIKKALKSLLVCFRFYSNYEQYTETGTVDLQKVLPLWKQMLENLEKNTFGSNQGIYTYYLKQFQKYKDTIRDKHPYIHTIKNLNNQSVHIGKNKNKPGAVIDYSQFQKELPAGQLNIINYLRKHGVEDLFQHFKVKYERHLKYPHIIQFQYLLSANFKHRIPRECRGLILNQSNKYQIVACPYFKFFDYNDRFCEIQIFDWATSQLYQKLDGSICALYYYQGWNVASSSKPDGSGNYCFSRKQTVTVFSEEFWRIFYSNGCLLPSEEDRDKTFVFQLMAMNHIIVVQHLRDRVVLHGCIHSKSCQQLPINGYEDKYKWEICKPLDIEYKGIEDIVMMAQKLNPRQQQGYILKDQNNMRMKVKSSNYLRVNFVNPINNNIVDKNFLIKLIRNNQHQQFIEYCPEWREEIGKITTHMDQLIETSFQYLERYQKLSNKELYLQSEGVMSDGLLKFIMLIRNYNLRREEIVNRLEVNMFVRLLEVEARIKEVGK